MHLKKFDIVNMVICKATHFYLPGMLLVIGDLPSKNIGGVCAEKNADILCMEPWISWWRVTVWTSYS